MTEHVTSEGLVLRKQNFGEANILVSILTKDHGLLRASAKSARREISKLRYALEPLSLGRFTFVRGRYEWKLIGTEGIVREYSASLRGRAATGRIMRLISRLVQGEEKNEALFGDIAEALKLFSRAQGEEEIQSIECVAVLRLLFNLGYLPKTPELAPFIADKGLSLALAAKAAERRSQLIRAINESLLATGL